MASRNDPKAKGLAKSDSHEKDWDFVAGLHAKIKGKKGKKKALNPRAVAAMRLLGMGGKQGQAAPMGNMQEGE